MWYPNCGNCSSIVNREQRWYPNCGKCSGIVKREQSGIRTAENAVA
jgi:ribosomal protein S27AE